MAVESGGCGEETCCHIPWKPKDALWISTIEEDEEEQVAEFPWGLPRDGINFAIPY